MFLCLKLIFLFSPLFYLIVHCQDLQIYGKFDSYLVPLGTRQKSIVTSTCFEGIGFETCVPKQPDDDFLLAEELLYYRNLESYVGQTYCLQCCGSDPSNIDTWDLYCPIISQSAINLYGYELRMARNKIKGDTEIISCPLKRSACSYSDTGATLSCNRSTDSTFLVGYTATIYLRRYNKNFQYWNGVTKCEIEAIESNTSLVAGENFHEKIIIIHHPVAQTSYDIFQTLMIIFFVFFICVVILYFCRRKRCPYCQKKLLFSLNMCIVCKIVGAEPPDPVLLQALEEKGQLLQGSLPERFPGSTIIVGFCQVLFKILTCRRKIKVTPITPKVVVKYQPDEMKLDIEKQIISPQMTPDVSDVSLVSALAKEPELPSTKAQKIKSTPRQSNSKSPRASKKKTNDSQTLISRLSPKKKPNPNALAYEPQVIYAAVRHPKFEK